DLCTAPSSRCAPCGWWRVRPPPPRPRGRTPRTRSSRRICSPGPSRPEHRRGSRVRPVARATARVDAPVPVQEVPVPTAPMTPAPSPQSRIRIIALGDELLAGVGDARALGWLGRAVAREQGAANRIDVFAAALPGETSAELADRCDEDVQRRCAKEGQADGSVDNRVVLAMGRADVEAGISLARSRLNLAKILDGLERLRVPAFVVGPTPS